MVEVIRRLFSEGVSGLGARQLKLFLNLYPPYLGAGVRVVHAADDFSRWDVEMKLTRYNRNYFGTHFGGSLYSMCDPFFLLIVIKMLGSEYLVWDKEASIRFKKPGRGRVKARFEVSRERIAEIKAEVDRKRKMDVVVSVEVVSDEGEVVAEVEKRLYVRKKGPYSRQ
jgi:acyl-coenzyme A thioesterase PaaI-like protein